MTSATHNPLEDTFVMARPAATDDTVTLRRDDIVGNATTMIMGVIPQQGDLGLESTAPDLAQMLTDPANSRRKPGRAREIALTLVIGVAVTAALLLTAFHLVAKSSIGQIFSLLF